MPLSIMFKLNKYTLLSLLATYGMLFRLA